MLRIRYEYCRYYHRCCRYRKCYKYFSYKLIFLLERKPDLFLEMNSISVTANSGKGSSLDDLKVWLVFVYYINTTIR